MDLSFGKKLDGAGWIWMRGCLRIFERQVLVFPLFVVFLACSSFLFGGRCAAWQWWVAVVMVVGAPFLKRNGWKTAVGAAGMFGVLLVVLKGGLPPMTWDNAFGVDTRLYHFPMVQLLNEGWNPVADPLAEEITAQLGLDLWGMSPILVAFFSKTMAIFASESYHFTGDPTSATIPGLALLWLSCAFQAFRTHRGSARWVALAAMVFVLPIMCRKIFVDMALAFASCGLLFTMEKDLRGGDWDWLHLGVYTVWMATIKLNGLLGAVVFWALFAVARIWRGRSEWHHWIGRFAVFGVATALAMVLISWNPMMTSWKAYGHPLYPFMSADEENYPSQEPGWDMRVVNEDFRRMSKAGIWFHEYISTDLTTKYYRWKTGNEQFEPKRTWIPDESYVHGRPWVRPALWAMFVLLLLLPRGRLWGIGGLLLTWLAPWDKIGYTRYEPWLTSLGCLSLALWADWTRTRWGGRTEYWITRCAIATMAFAVFFWGWHHARNIEFKAEECDLIRQRIRTPFWANTRDPSDGVNPEDFIPRNNYLTAQENQTILLAKEMGWDGKTEVLTAAGWVPPAKSSHVRRPLWKYDERAWFKPDNEKDMCCLEDLGEPWFAGDIWDGFGDLSKTEPWIMTPWQRYWVPLNDHAEHIMAYYTDAESRLGETHGKRLWRSAKRVTKAWCITYPQEAWKWLAGQKLKSRK